jgi:hypothetical protein
MSTQSNPQPNWQPISSLPLIGTALDGMLESAREQYSNLQQAKSRPYTLDDCTVEVIISAYRQQADDLWLYEEQLRRWKGEEIAEKQRQEVRRLEGQLEQLSTQIRSILSLTEELKKETIESLLNKSDLEVAMDFLSGKLQIP